ncbi:MAG: hypothetical protein R3C58_07850 [Parvularculaceae bacterium]
MLSVASIALMMAAVSEPGEARLVSQLFGAPVAEVKSFAATCGGRTYSFDYRREKMDHSIEFHRTPVPAPKDFTETLIGILDKFPGGPDIKAWCTSSREETGPGIVMLLLSGVVDADDRDERADCLKRDGKYDSESLWIVEVEDDAVSLYRDKLGQCTTKADIDEFQRMTGGAKK